MLWKLTVEVLLHVGGVFAFMARLCNDCARAIIENVRARLW